MEGISQDIVIVGYDFSGTDLVENMIRRMTDICYPTRNVNTVCCKGQLPSHCGNSVLRSTNKVMFVIRNPKDVATVMYRTTGQETTVQFAVFLQEFLSGNADNWCSFTRNWLQSLSHHPSSNLHLVYFKDLIQYREEEVMKIKQFLQVPELETIIRDKLDQPECKRRKTDNFTHQRTDDLGIWKNYFTVSQQEQFDAIIRNNFKETALDLDKLLT